MTRPLIEQMAVVYATEIEKLQAEIAQLRDQLGEALVRENNLRAALEEAREAIKAGDEADAIGTISRALANEQETGVSHLGE